MDTLGFGSPIQTYRDNTHRMRVSNGREGSDPKNLCSKGVVDLDLSLRAFDSKLPFTRMMPGSSPCELRLLLPDSKIGPDGFHDVLWAFDCWRLTDVGVSLWTCWYILRSEHCDLQRESWR